MNHLLKSRVFYISIGLLIACGKQNTNSKLPETNSDTVQNDSSSTVVSNQTNNSHEGEISTSTIAGTWDVMEYEMKGMKDGHSSYKSGDWVFEFDNTDQLTTSKPISSIKPSTIKYHIKNENELWIIDNGQQIPYSIINFTSKSLELDSPNENLKLTRR